MKLARSSFYYRPKAKSPERMKAEADLRDRIEAICLEFPATATAGSPSNFSMRNGG